MANDYTTAAEVIADMPGTGLAATTDANFSTAVSLMISAASRLIDKEVGRWPGYFYPSTSAETRYFDTVGGDEVEIDECVSITTLSVAEDGGRGTSDYTDWTANTDYYTAPYNANADGIPIRRVIIEPDGSKSWFPKSRKGLKVAGIFGYCSTPPANVQLACKIQAIRWVQRAKQAYQDASANAATGGLIYAQALDPDVINLLAPYRLENAV